LKNPEALAPPFVALAHGPCTSSGGPCTGPCPEKMLLFGRLSGIHSMARANLNKSKSLDLYYHSIKVHPQESASIKNFQTQTYLVKVPLNVNIVKQDLLNKKQFLKML
jgi:hypothetical protein